MGSSETEVNALAVIPCTSSSKSTVIMVTPVAKLPIALRTRVVGKLAEVRCSVCGVEEAHIQRIKNVERFRERLQVDLFGDVEGTGNSHVHALVTVTLEGIPSFPPHAVVIPEDVAVHVRACKLGEVVRRFQADDG